MPSALIDTSSSGDNTIIPAPTNGAFIVVYQYTYVLNAATTVRFKAGASLNLTGPMSPGANGGVSAESNVEPLFTLPPNTAFVMNSTAAVAVGGHVTYAIRQSGSNP